MPFTITKTKASAIAISEVLDRLAEQQMADEHAPAPHAITQSDEHLRVDALQSSGAGAAAAPAGARRRRAASQRR